MVDVRGDVLRPPHGTTPAAVKANKIQKLSSFKSNENIHKREDKLVARNPLDFSLLSTSAEFLIDQNKFLPDLS